jgi:hypothetical protein
MFADVCYVFNFCGLTAHLGCVCMLEFGTKIFLLLTSYLSEFSCLKDSLAVYIIFVIGLIIFTEAI